MTDFETAFGRPSDGVWSAPGRVNLIGEHTDYNDGFVLPLALDRRTWVAAARTTEPGWTTVRSDREDQPVRFAASTVAPGQVAGWACYVAGVVWAFREAGLPVADTDLFIHGDVPVGAGLSSSASLECAVAVALAGLAEIPVEKTPFARIARRAENEFVGAPTGGMDQMAAMHGAPDRLVFLDTRTEAVELIPFDLATHDLALLVLDTRAPHQLVDGQYGERRHDCAEAAALLDVPSLRDATLDAVGALDDRRLRARARHVVTENARVLEVVDRLRGGRDPREIGPLLTASHESMRDDFAITVPHVDVAQETALAAGAHGARMTGGGFGGCVIALVEVADVDAVTRAVEAAYADRGWEPPVAFTAVASAGAGR
ncbi:galactokinase [Pseudonocardia xishanensis]|uniref:Galactokinase n=1 Tax=Pseudonocardia xishanensis TaxID=630995 RepID=A0ABP8S0S3_9PSEU